LLYIKYQDSFAIKQKPNGMKIVKDTWQPKISSSFRWWCSREY